MHNACIQEHENEKANEAVRKAAAIAKAQRAAVQAASVAAAATSPIQKKVTLSTYDFINIYHPLVFDCLSTHQPIS